MKFNQTNLDSVFLIDTNCFTDERGFFIKPFHKETFLAQGLECDFDECFYSESKKNVLRGMHFQLPPHQHAKLIFVPQGKILDVAVDLRKGSPTYGQYAQAELSATNKRLIYIPAGCAHGFLTLSETALVFYLQTSMHNKDADSGIAWDSFGMEWGTNEPIISDRDSSFMKLSEFDSPF